MAQLKSTIVQGALTVTSNVVANKLIKQGGSAIEVLFADGSTKTLDQIKEGIDTGVISISDTGTGNAITDLTISDDTRTLTVSRGDFLTEHQSLENYVTLKGDETIEGVKTFTTKQKLNAGASLNQTGVLTWPAKTKDSNVQKYFDIYVEDVLGIKYGGTSVFSVGKSGNVSAAGSITASSGTFTNNVTAKGFVAKDSDDSYVLLAGGGTRTVESIKNLVTIPDLSLKDNTTTQTGVTYPVIGDISVNGHEIQIVKKSLEDLGLSTVYKFKGSCKWAELLDLPKAEVGDVYNITDADKNNLTGSDWACFKAFSAKISGDKYADHWQSIGGINDWQGMLSSYLPLTGSSYTSTDDTTIQPNNMTGPIVFYNVDGIKINSKDSDRKIWEVYGNSGRYKSQYGFDMFYKGSANGNDNSLSLYAHNGSSATHIEVYKVLQDGATTWNTAFNFAKVRPTYNNKALALQEELPEDTNTWRPIDVKIGDETKSLTSDITSSKLALKQGSNIVMEYSEGTVTFNAEAVSDSTNSDDKLYLIGAKEQGENQTTFSDEEVYVTNGTLTTSKTQVGGGAITMEYDSSYKALKFVFA